MSNWTDEELQKIFDDYKAAVPAGQTIIVRDLLRHALGLLCPAPAPPAVVVDQARSGIQVRALDDHGRMVYDHIRASTDPAGEAQAAMQFLEYKRLAESTTFDNVPLGGMYLSSMPHTDAAPAAAHQIAGRAPRAEREYLARGRFKSETDQQAALGWAGWCETRGNHMLADFLKDVGHKLSTSRYTEWPEYKQLGKDEGMASRQYTVGWNEAVRQCRLAVAPPVDVLVQTPSWRRLVQIRPGAAGQYIAEVTDTNEQT